MAKFCLFCILAELMLYSIIKVWFNFFNDPLLGRVFKEKILILFNCHQVSGLILHNILNLYLEGLLDDIDCLFN